MHAASAGCMLQDVCPANPVASDRSEHGARRGRRDWHDGCSVRLPPTRRNALMPESDAIELPAIPYRDGVQPAAAAGPGQEDWALVEGVWN